MTAKESFLTLYASTHEAADILGRTAKVEAVSLAAAQRLVELSRQSACAAQALRDRLAGHPEPRRGE